MSARGDAKETSSCEILPSLPLRLEFANQAQDDIDQALRGNCAGYTISDWYARVCLLVQTIGKESRTRQNRTVDTRGLAILSREEGKLGLAQFYASDDVSNNLHELQKMVRALGLDSPIVSVDKCPRGSFLVRLNFTLEKPYISKDDVEFYVVDNPVRKEWVFKVPYISGSQWKGALRHSVVRSLVESRNSISNDDVVRRRLAITRIFGTEKGTPDDGSECETYLDEIFKDTRDEYWKRLRELLHLNSDEIPHVAGRVHLFPTYFSRISLEVINPHNEEGGGTQPIYFETVPSGASGTFCLLYVPLTTCWGSEEKDVKLDREMVLRGIKDMMTVYGFGAKTSLGYGRANQLVRGGKVYWRTGERESDTRDVSFDDLTKMEVGDCEC
ncbi:MAG: RAMP superfamily CRISPR-associated protein [Candidatus Thorarchaeota archaeon]